jgi:SAM-dependent methyltransferase
LALSLLVDMVGPDGLVLGIDASSAALATARQRVNEHGIAQQVQLVEADVNSLDPSVLGDYGQFDFALCRLLLTHQTDPAATLRAIAKLIRPGGRIVALDPLRDQGFPRLDPPLPQLERIRDLDIEHLRLRGLAHDVAWEYAELCVAAGLVVVDWRGTLDLRLNDTTMLEFVRRLLPAQRDGLIGTGLTTEAEIDQLTTHVDEAIARGVHRSASMIMGELIAEVPA